MFWSTVPYSTLTASDVTCLLTLLPSSRFSPAAARRVPAFEDLRDSHWVTQTIQDNLPISGSSVGHICKVQVATYGTTFTGPGVGTGASPGIVILPIAPSINTLMVPLGAQRVGRVGGPVDQAHLSDTPGPAFTAHQRHYSGNALGPRCSHLYDQSSHLCSTGVWAGIISCCA